MRLIGLPESLGLLTSEDTRRISTSQLTLTDLGTGMGRSHSSSESYCIRQNAVILIKFVENAVEQGEKVIIFTSFLNTMQRFRQHFKEKAVYVSGACSFTSQTGQS